MCIISFYPPFFTNFIYFKKCYYLMMKIFKNNIFWLAIIFICLVIFIPKTFYIWDELTFGDWLIHLRDGGLLNIYNHKDVNYFPLYIYFLDFFQSIFASTADILANIHLLKIFTLIFDFGGLIVLNLSLKHFKIKTLNPIFFILNIGYLYNTLFWGQIDAIHSFFMFLSIFLILKEKPTLAVLSFVLALNLKLQSVVFAPVLIIVLLPFLVKDPKQIVKILISSLVLQFVIFAPFIFANKMNDIISIATSSVGFFPYLSLQAFNAWYLIAGPSARWMTDNITYIGLTAKNIGLMLFAISSIVALIPSVKIVKDMIKQKTSTFTKSDFASICLTVGLLFFNFFFFNTQMHERYIHPAMLFIFAYAFLEKKPIIYILISLLYFLNLEKVLMILPINHLNNPFLSSRIIAGMYTILIAYLYYLHIGKLIFRKKN